LKITTKLLAAAFVLFGAHIQTVKAENIKAFAATSVYFEQNATDGDGEVVLKVNGGDEGMSKLKVVSPDGRTVIDFTASDASTLGIRQFVFESPEPEDIEGLKMAYKEGVYTFTGITSSGDKLHGKAELSHKLPNTVSFIQPKANAHDVIVEDLIINWTSVRNVSAYIIKIDQEDLDVNLEAKLSGTSTSFAVPNGFLRLGTEYKLGIGTVKEDGNASFIETTFKTAGSSKS